MFTFHVLKHSGTIVGSKSYTRDLSVTMARIQAALVWVRESDRHVVEISLGNVTTTYTHQTAQCEVARDVWESLLSAALEDSRP